MQSQAQTSLKGSEVRLLRPSVLDLHIYSDRSRHKCVTETFSQRAELATDYSWAGFVLKSPQEVVGFRLQSFSVNSFSAPEASSRSDIFSHGDLFHLLTFFQLRVARKNL